MGIRADPSFRPRPQENLEDAHPLCPLVPYEIDDKVLLDIQQVLPLPEAADYQVRLRRKDAARHGPAAAGATSRYHLVVHGVEWPHQNKRNAIRSMVEELAAPGTPLAEIRKLMPERVMRILAGRFVDADADTQPIERPALPGAAVVPVPSTYDSHAQRRLAV